MKAASMQNPEWSVTRGKLKESFSKLTDEAIESMKNDLSRLAGKLQSAYGYGKEKAEAEYQKFKVMLSETLDSTPKMAIVPNHRGTSKDGATNPIRPDQREVRSSGHASNK